MPAQYELKAIGDQVYRLTLQLEIEKILTDTLLRALSLHGLLSQKTIDGILDQLPKAKDDEGELFTALYHSRLLGIHERLGTPPNLGD